MPSPNAQYFLLLHLCLSALCLRLFTLFLVCISILWIPIIQTANSGQLFDYIQSVTSFLAPPITAVFLLAIFWPRANEQGAFWGLMGGLLVGVTRMVLEFSYAVPSCGEPDLRPAVLAKVHYLYFSLLLFALSGVIICIVSLATEPIPPHCLHRLTWWSRHSQEPREDLPGVALEPERPAPPSDPSASSSEPPVSDSRWCRALLWVCGLTGQSGSSAPPESCPLGSLQEEPLWRHVCNINALLLLTVNVFLWGYFA